MQFNIMFVCTGNTCRSPMAEVGLRSLLEKERPSKAIVISSGIMAIEGYSATDFAIEAVRLWECDLSKHRSSLTSIGQIEEADLIIGMAPEHVKEVNRIDSQAKTKTYLFKNFPDSSPTGEPVDDPIGQPLAQYNETFLEIGEYLGKSLPAIVKLIDEKFDA